MGGNVHDFTLKVQGGSSEKRRGRIYVSKLSNRNACLNINALFCLKTKTTAATKSTHFLVLILCEDIGIIYKP